MLKESKKTNVYIVEDDKNIREALRYNLIAQGFNVEFTGDGISAIETLLNKTFDIILLDLMLPGIDGLEICKRIRSENIFWPLAGTVNGARIGADGRLGDHYPQIWKPVIGAINGWAAGAGFYLMLTSMDIRIASIENAKFKFALLSQGWVGSGPGATYLTRQVSHADAMKILLTDQPFDAEEALRMNLINEVVPHSKLMERAEEIADGIVKMPPLAVRMMKEFIIRFRDIPVTEAWRVQTLMNSLLTQLSADGEEGRRAFLEKRPPDFSGSILQKGDPYDVLSESDRQRIDEIRREQLG